MMKQYLLALPILPALLTFGSSHAGTSTGAAAVTGGTELRCEVRTTRRSGRVMLTAAASADRNTRGAYEFLVEKGGSAGTSMVSQSGDFALAAGAEAVLGRADLGLERRASFTAVLHLEDGQGTVLCSAEAAK